MTNQDRMTRVYDRTMVGSNQRRYYGDSGFYNLGYWNAQTTTQRQASELLVDRLVEKIPNKKGRILDVACGLGASTRRLSETYSPENITGINISAAQITAAVKRAPGCTFHRMDATQLDFPDAYFDAVICVEAAFHFDTREAFIREALRVLRPGGILVISDILFRRFVALFAKHSQVPPANLVPDIATYEARLAAAGFEEIAVEDVTKASVGGFRHHLSRWPGQQRRAGKMKLGKCVGASIICQGIAGYFGAVCKTYLLASARKPGTAE